MSTTRAAQTLYFSTDRAFIPLTVQELAKVLALVPDRDAVIRVRDERTDRSVVDGITIHNVEISVVDGLYYLTLVLT